SDRCEAGSTSMTRSVVLLLLASCAPSNEYTPEIPIQSGAESRICWFCVQAPPPIAQRCPSRVIADRCRFLHSDVVRPPRIRRWPEDGGLVARGAEDSGAPEQAEQ